MSFKSQSAMEYLMTYGWAILIIAIVMVALFQLGVFNGTFFAPRATAGACEVYRSVEGINLVGQCQGELPQFVAQFNGQNSYININNSTVFDFNGFTLNAWIRPVPNGIIGYTDEGIINKNGNIIGSPSGSSESYLLTLEQGPSYPPYISPSGFVITSNGEMWIGSGLTPSANYWYFITLSFDKTTYLEKIYVDGVLENSLSANGPIVNNNAALGIGGRGSASGQPYRIFNGLIANVQVYNATLSANQIGVLYQEGVGGAPIDPTHIVGWWPLNGNAQDYSGNNNGGVPTNVVYTSSWTSGYTQP